MEAQDLIKLSARDKIALLIDLSARLPYGVQCEIIYGNDSEQVTVKSPITLTATTYGMFASGESIGNIKIYSIKPLLRQLSDLTSAEYAEYQATLSQGQLTVSTVDWMNKFGVDYRGLLKSKLALKLDDYGK